MWGNAGTGVMDADAVNAATVALHAPIPGFECSVTLGRKVEVGIKHKGVPGPHEHTWGGWHLVPERTSSLGLQAAKFRRMVAYSVVGIIGIVSILPAQLARAS